MGNRWSPATVKKAGAVVVVAAAVAAGCGDDSGSEDVAPRFPEISPLTTPTNSTSTTTVVDFFFESEGIGESAVPLTSPLERGHAVATAHPLATEAGMEILAKGGSAVDAAIAIQAVLGLVEPQSSGIGGGAFMLHYDATTQAVTAYDGREEAPAGASSTMFLGGNGAPLSFAEASGSGDAVGTPGVVAMLAAAHEDHGRFDWSGPFESAIDHARRGFEVSRRMADAIGLALVLGASDDLEALYTDVAGGSLTEGELFVNPAYADTLTAIAADWRALYEGEIAAEIVAATGAEPRPGALTTADLAGYEARRLEALCRPYREWTLCGAPPPTSGGVGLLSLMGQLEALGVDRLGPSGAGWHLFIEASQRAYADRDLYVADDRFVAVPVDELLDRLYLAARASGVDPTEATPDVSAGVIEGFPRGADSTVEAGGTSHFVVVDDNGDVVTMTTSVESVFGSRRVAAGFVLNNQLTDFAFEPTDGGVPVANAIAPGKRPRSSMAPTIVLDVGGDVRLAMGSPGGSSIIAYVAKTLVGILDWGLSAEEAIALPNVVGRDGAVAVESPPATTALLSSLTALGHDVGPSALVEDSGIQVIEIGNDGTFSGGADPRREGTFDTTAE